MAKRLFTLRWILTTLLVIAGVAVLIRLGIWQLDRLEQRRAFNARVQSQLVAPALDLTPSNLGGDLYNMEYRAVTLHGDYDFSQEVLLRNQVWDNHLGVHLLTPFKIAGSDRYVLVDRGWIPAEDSAPEKRAAYQQPGEVTVTGILRRSQPKPDFGGVPDPTLAPGQARYDAVNIVDVERIQQQVSGSLLPVFVQAGPIGDNTALPYRKLPIPELTEGPHFGYALQWFAFAAILGLGYPFFVRKQLSEKGKPINALEALGEKAADSKEAADSKKAAGPKEAAGPEAGVRKNGHKPVH